MPPTTMVIPDRAIPPIGSTKEIINYYKESTPIKIIIDWLKKHIIEYGGKPAKSPSDKILIIRAKTGSGKSTTMPVEIYRLFKPKDSMVPPNKSILVTQPRVLTTQEIPRDIAVWAKDLVLGKTLGYSTGSGKMLGEQGQKGLLLYATIDTLLAQLRGDNPKETIMKLYKVIILDEVHERSMTFDMTVMLMKKFIMENYKNPDCPFLILTSATFDVIKYCRFFNVLPKTNLIDIIGNVFHTTEQFLKEDSNNTNETCISLVKDIHEERINPMKPDEDDILIFCYGMMPMKELKEHLLKYNVELIKENKKLFVVCIIEGKAVNFNTIDRQIVYMEKEKLKINDAGEYDKKGKYNASRRIILSSNVAETGLTVPTLGHCIDMGWKNVKETYSPYGITGMIVKPVDKSNVMQRRGRVGRKFPGNFYAMYTEKTFNQLRLIQLPSIITEDISNNIIDILIQQNNCFDVNKIDMLDTPSTDSLKMSIEKNITLGYIDSDYGKCYTMTELGNKARSNRYMKIEIFRSIISGYVYDICIPDLITIFSMLSLRIKRKVIIENVIKESLPAFFFEYEDYMNIYTSVTMDDFITGLFIFESFVIKLEKSIKEAEEFCEKNYISFVDMINIIKTRIEYMEDLSKLKLDPFYLKDKSLTKSNKKNYFEYICKIKQCIYDGFRLNIIKNNKKQRSYIDRFNNIVKVKNPNTKIGFPEIVITNEIKIGSNPMLEKFNFNLEADRVSVLDGYIGIDMNFITPILSLSDKKDISTSDLDNLESITNYNNVLLNNNNYKILFSDIKNFVDI